MWAEASLRISAAAEVCDPSFAEYQRNNLEPVEAGQKASPSGEPSGSCVPAYVPDAGSSSSPSSSFSSNVFWSPSTREKIRHEPRNVYVGTAQHHVKASSTCTGETKTPAHTCLSGNSKLELPRDGTYRAEEELNKLLLQRDHAAGNFEQRGPPHGSQAFSIPQADSEGGVIIFPSPECVLKSKLESGEKVFINLCGHDGIEHWHHKDILLEEDGHETTNEALRIPLSVGERTECNDKAGAPALAVDVVFNKGTLSDCLKQPQLKQLLAQFAMAAVSHKYNLKLQEPFSFPRLTYKSRGSNPRPQRIKRVKTPEINQITGVASASAAGHTPNQSAPLPFCAFKAVSSSRQSSPMPTFECWFLRPFALHNYILFVRDKLPQKSTQISTVYGEQRAANPGTRALAFFEGSASPSKRGCVELPDLSNTHDGLKGDNEANAPSCVPFLSLWLATACTEEAGEFEDTDGVEKKGAINAFDFDRIAHEEGGVCNDAEAPSVSPPMAVKGKHPSHQEVKGVEQPVLPMKRAFLLSPEERLQRKQVIINQSLLQGTIFVFQLDVRSLRENASESTLSHLSDSTVGMHGLEGPNTQLFTQSTQQNGSAASSPAVVTTKNAPRTTFVAPLREAPESSTLLAFPPDSDAHSTSFTACSTKGSDQIHAAKDSFTTAGTASFPAPTSGCCMKYKCAKNLHAATSFPTVEISDTQLVVTCPNKNHVPKADRACPSSCSADYLSSTFPPSSSSSARPAGTARSCITTESRRFLYVFPFAFRSNFAHAFLSTEEVLTVLVPTDLSAAGVLEEEVMALARPPLFEEAQESRTDVHDSVQLSTCLALSCQGSCIPTQHDPVHSTMPQTDVGDDPISNGDVIAPRAYHAAEQQANTQSLSKGFANETLDAIF